MFNRRINQRVSPAVQHKNDITSLNNLRSKNLEQRVITIHEASIQSLNTKLNELSSKISESSKVETPETIKEHPDVLKLKEQSDIQSKLLKEYEEKVVNLVGYIKRLEQGLETVKELLTNKTNTADTMDAVPEFDEPKEEVEGEKVEESKQKEEVTDESLTVEKVKEETEATTDKVSLEIVDEETV